MTEQKFMALMFIEDVSVAEAKTKTKNPKGFN